ncbi:MAG: FecR family protein [Flavobacteriaceae bacterium]|nr:FecR family protein [Flavobacteriaceae bacterium]
MKMNKLDDIFLSRWLNNELSGDELNKFKSSEHYNSYVNIIKGTDKLQAPSYNLNEAFSNIKEKRNTTTIIHPSTPSKNRWQWGVAASVILFIGFFAYFNLFNTTEFSSDYGKQLAFELPDGSKVLLNSKSTITFNTKNWDTNRTLELNGEAFFDVEKGNTFTVKTSQGNVSVLGTEFNVNARTDFFKVSCYEGKVKVSDNSDASTHILTPSIGYQNIKNNTPITLNFDSTHPEWIDNQSVFKSTPIKFVFNALEKQYELQFEYDSFDDSILFTGSFPNNNKEIALKTVLKSVNLKYTTQGNSIILED